MSITQPTTNNNTTNNNTTNTTPPSHLAASFNTSASTYERRIGRATRAIASHIVSAVLPATLPASPVILDNACGTGAITSAAVSRYPSAQVHAVDASPGMIDIMHAKIRAVGWPSGNVRPAVMGGQNLKFDEGTFDASVTNFGIFFFPDPVVGAREIRRTLKEGGVAVVTCWRASPGDLVLRNSPHTDPSHRTFPITSIYDAAEAIVQPSKPFERPAFLSQWRDPATLERVLRDGGFEEVELHGRDVWYWGHDVQDLAGALCENMFGFLGEDWTAEERGRLGAAMVKVVGGSESAQLVEKLDGEGPEWKGRLGLRLGAWIGVARK